MRSAIAIRSSSTGLTSIAALALGPVGPRSPNALLTRSFVPLACLTLLFAGLLSASLAQAQSRRMRLPILVYHRFGARVTDSMTVRTAIFAGQLRFLKEHHITAVPLRGVVRYFLGQAPPPPPNSIVITADDGHVSVFSDMLPLVKQYKIPVTLFIYPSAISNASYAMTWEELAKLKATGLFDVQSHTFWHPNFRIEKQRRSPADYRRFVREQLVKSKGRLEHKLGGKVDMLAWPFGIYDDELIGLARECGYLAGFSIVRRPATSRDNVMALPRYLMTEADQGRAFERIVEGESLEPQPQLENMR
jgi:peptidoglycan/xylan/chitin deacetylase (PgdA/CDA1 family)